VFVGLAATGAVSAQDSPHERPNFVVVLVDDMRWDDIGAGGHPFVETPNIDRIAREGARFVNAFTTTPLCSPARASFLTGLYAHTHGITDNLARDEASHRLPTFPKALHENGYRTAFIGKWHMGNDDSPRPGFDRWVAMRGQGEAIDPLLNVDGTRTPTEGYATDILTDYALEFIEVDDDAPFLAYVSHKALHPNIMQRDDGSSAALEGQPPGFVAAPRHRGRYADEEIARRQNASTPVEGKPALERSIDGLPPLEPGGGTSDDTIRQRLEMLLAVDDSVGRILETLGRAGELDDTVVVVTSDHGYFYGEHGLGGERRLAYEETARIPMLVRYPRLIAAGTEVDELVLCLDLAATLLELGDTEPIRPLHGRSFVPLVRGETPDDWRTAFLIEYYSDTVFRRIVNMGYKAVRTDRYKYIHYLELEGMDELYDLDADPYETRNIIDEPENESILKSLQKELERQLDLTSWSPAFDDPTRRHPKTNALHLVTGQNGKALLR
jgi:N-acetylglucosamine-6-sulfatase